MIQGVSDMTNSNDIEVEFLQPLVAEISWPSNFLRQWCKFWFVYKPSFLPWNIIMSTQSVIAGEGESKRSEDLLALRPPTRSARSGIV